MTIPGDITLTVLSGLNGQSPQLTLTCISTGGPATTVTWTRDSTTVTEGTETVLDDPVTAQYTHTLNVTGRIGVLYTCTVSNNKPSSASASFTLQGLYITHPIVDMKPNYAVWLPFISSTIHVDSEAHYYSVIVYVLFLSLPQFSQRPSLPLPSPSLAVFRGFRQRLGLW